MPVLTDLSSAEIKRHVLRLYGRTMTRPTLLASDGINPTYVVDVNIGPTDPTGRIRQYITEQQAKDEDLDEDDSMLTGIPGQRPEDWQLDDSLPGHVDTTLRNVPIARNNRDMIYANIGAPVTVTRYDARSRWEVTGFSIEQPGTHFMYPVDLGDMTIGTVINLSYDTRLLTLAEIGEKKPFGFLPFGASAIFQGGTLVRIV